MENIWLYFFSSLLQAAAALIALFSIFVVFKIEKINNKINEIRQLIIKIFIKIKNNETTPGADQKQNKNFCEKFKITRDKYTYEKYSNKNILDMINEFWSDRSNFLGVSTQFGNDLITEETITILSKIVSDKKSIIHKLIINLTSSVLLIILSSIFLSFSSNYRDMNIVYLMILLVSLITIYNAYSIYSIIKTD